MTEFFVAIGVLSTIITSVFIIGNLAMRWQERCEKNKRRDEQILTLRNELEELKNRR